MRDIEFVSGIQASRDLRRRIIDFFGAEEGLLRGEDSSSVITWLAGDLITEFHVSVPSAEAINFSMLTVRTLVAGIDDMNEALKWANGLNDVTCLNRWSVINVPEVLGPYLADEPYSGQPCLISEISFVCGTPFTDVPDEAVFMAVGEQIARATALSTNAFYKGWGSSKSVQMSINGVPALGPFHPVVGFFEKIIGNGDDDDANALFDVAERALNSVVELQELNGERAWVVKSEDDFVQFTVPFKGQNPGEESVVNIRPSVNPQLGPGLMFAMKCDVGGSIDYPLDYANSLNQLGAYWHIGYAHNFGAWAEVQGQMIYKVFVPAAWNRLMDGEELFDFFSETYENFARISVGAYVHSQGPLFALDSPLGLMAIGDAARGSAYGETGFGVDEYKSSK